MAKLRISERNTKEKLVFLFIPEREELRQSQSYAIILEYRALSQFFLSKHKQCYDLNLSHI